MAQNLSKTTTEHETIRRWVEERARLSTGRRQASRSSAARTTGRRGGASRKGGGSRAR